MLEDTEALAQTINIRKVALEPVKRRGFYLDTTEILDADQKQKIIDALTIERNKGDWISFINTAAQVRMLFPDVPIPIDSLAIEEVGKLIHPDALFTPLLRRQKYIADIKLVAPQIYRDNLLRPGELQSMMRTIESCFPDNPKGATEFLRIIALLYPHEDLSRFKTEENWVLLNNKFEEYWQNLDFRRTSALGADIRVFWPERFQQLKMDRERTQKLTDLVRERSAGLPPHVVATLVDIAWMSAASIQVTPDTITVKQGGMLAQPAGEKSVPLPVLKADK